MTTRIDVENAMVELEAAGEKVTTHAVRAKIGGRYPVVLEHMRAIRAGTGGQAPAGRVSPVQQQLTEALTTQRDIQNRLGVLSTKAVTEPLTPTETSEQIILERQLQNLAPSLARFQKAAAREQQRADIDGAVHAWQPLAARKLEAYQDFVQAIYTLRQAFAVILALHREQEGILATLPRPLQEKLSFPDESTQGQRIIGRLPRGYDLQFVLLTPETLRAVDLAEMTDVDPGTKALPHRLLEPYREEED
jgi:hypothetical protein